MVRWIFHVKGIVSRDFEISGNRADWAITPLLGLTFDDLIVFQLCVCDKNNNKYEPW
jgi:hypothetical protein